MKFKYWLIIAFCIVVSAGSIIYFFTKSNDDYEYVMTGKVIDDYRIYRVYKEAGLPAEREVIVFATSDYKYSYSISMSGDEYHVKVDDEYIPLSRFIFKYWITNEEIEESGIGSRTYWSDE